MKAKGGADCKLRGELAEIMFLLKATTEKFIVSKPWGDSRPYDFIVDSGARLSRVQVKAVFGLPRGMYELRVARGQLRPYTAAQIDFLADLVVPEDAWYVFPVNVVCGRYSINVFPRRRAPSPYERFREAWHLLR